MAPQTPFGEPTTVRAGDTWKWRQRFMDYPIADSWVIEYHIRGVDRLDWDATWVTDDGSEWTVEIPAATTLGVAAGGYSWLARVTDGSETYTVTRGILTVEADLETAEAVTHQSHAERMVAVLEAELEARITGTGSAHEGYMVAGRSIQKIPTQELSAMLGRYHSKLRRERNPGQFLRNITTRFVAP